MRVWVGALVGLLTASSAALGENPDDVWFSICVPHQHIDDGVAHKMCGSTHWEGWKEVPDVLAPGETCIPADDVLSCKVGSSFDMAMNSD
jgi:hypothetical protein